MSHFQHIALIMLISAALLWQHVENKSFFGIGMRVYGDHLLLKDVQQSRPAGIGEQPTIRFNYAMREPITYFEITSEENIYAEVNFGYHDTLVNGSVTTIDLTSADQVENENSTLTPSFDTKPRAHAFEILLKIYGFNDTMLNVSPAYVLNRDKQFGGVLKPYDEPLGIDVEVSFDDFGPSLLEKRNSQLELDEEGEGEDEGEDSQGANADESTEGTYIGTQLLNIARDILTKKDDEVDNVEGVDGVDNNEFEHLDKTIEIGKRQAGDYLIYETYQTSDQSTKEPTNQTVTFYYIDSDYITYVKFIVLDHFATKSYTSDGYLAPVGDYTHYSPNTLKAVITEFNVISMFVQMFIYGYKPADKPSDYQPFLPAPHWQRFAEATEDSKLTDRLRRLLEEKNRQQIATVIEENNNDDIDDYNFTVSPMDAEFEQINLIKVEASTESNSAQTHYVGQSWTRAVSFIAVCVALML